MNKEIINTDKAPAAIGPYSQAVKAGGLIFISGQIPINPATGDLVTTDIEAETRQVLDNLKAVCEAGGSSLAKIIKTNIFLKDLGNFSTVNEIYGEYFPEPYPARACVEVSKLPKDVNVEIEAVAIA